ncbi:MAG TPA: MBL fold metallo-hydrolase [Stellaceae bacterium]|nr:MBL fold metallo-hydrolase [Stellaceae bacterium]
MGLMRQWTIGRVRVSCLADLAGHTDPIQVLIADGSADWLLSYPWLRPHFVTPDGRMVISFQCFLVETPTRKIMVDTCIGNDRQRHFDVFCNLKSRFFEDLEELGCPREAIDTVLCTHLHLDHVGWNTHLADGKWVPSFPNARYLFGRAEWEHAQAMAKAGDHSAAHLPDSVEPIVAAGLADFIETDHFVCNEIKLMATPGHTPGHVSVLISSDGHDAIITGDVMHHPVQCAEPDRHGNFDVDKPLACASRRRVLDVAESRRLFVIGSHFPDPTAGWIERDGATWRFRTE